MRDEEARVFMQAAEEIRVLRKENEILSAKVEVMELFGLVFRTQPNYGGVTMGEDVLWKIDCLLKARAKQAEDPQ